MVEHPPSADPIGWKTIAEWAIASGGFLLTVMQAITLRWASSISLRVKELEDERVSIGRLDERLGGVGRQLEDMRDQQRDYHEANQAQARQKDRDDRDWRHDTLGPTLNTITIEQTRTAATLEAMERRLAKLEEANGK